MKNNSKTEENLSPLHDLMQLTPEIEEDGVPYEPLPWEEEYLRQSQPLPTTLAPVYTSDSDNPYLKELL